MGKIHSLVKEQKIKLEKKNYQKKSRGCVLVGRRGVTVVGSEALRVHSVPS